MINGMDALDRMDVIGPTDRSISEEYRWGYRWRCQSDGSSDPRVEPCLGWLRVLITNKISMSAQNHSMEKRTYFNLLDFELDKLNCIENFGSRTFLGRV